jgi:hypothetical protein
MIFGEIAEIGMRGIDEISVDNSKYGGGEVFAGDGQ